jgi:hypothetical protein
VGREVSPEQGRLVRALLLGCAVAAALLASTSPRSSSAEQLLTNGGFEDGAAGWRADGVDLTAVESPRVEGSFAGKATLAARESGRIFRPFPFEPGRSYRFSGSIRVDDPDANYVMLQLFADGGAEPYQVARLHGANQTFQEFSTPASLIPCDATLAEAHVIVSRRPQGAAEVFLDDLRVEAVGQAQDCPDPTLPPPPPPATPTTGRPPTEPRPTPTARAVVPGDPDDPTSTAGPTPAPSVLVNGGFESADNGVPVGWETYGGVLGQSSRHVHGGRYAGGFASNSDSTKWVYQTLPVRAGDWYELAGYVYHDDPRTEAALLRISWYASRDGSGSALDSIDSTETLDAPAARYRRLTTGAVQAPPGARSAKARILLRPHSATSAVIYIDDVTFRQTAPGPVPTGEAAAEERASRRGGRSGSSSGGYDEVASTLDRRSASIQPTPVDRRSSPLEAVAPGGGAWWPWLLVPAAGIAMGGLGLWWGRRRTNS